MSTKHWNVFEGDTLKGVRRNKTAALALAISLWLAGGGVASAGWIYVNADDGNKVVVNYSSPDKVPTDAIIDPGNGTTGVTSLTIGSNNPNGSDWSSAGSWSFNGWEDKNESGSDLNGYHLTVDGVKKAKAGIIGAWAEHGGNVTDNTVTVIDTSCYEAASITGGQSDHGNATGNKVKLTNVYLTSKEVNSIQIDNSMQLDNSMQIAVIGGCTKNPNMKASGNSVTLKDSTVGAVFGGLIYNDDGTQTGGNTVTLQGGNTVGGDLVGGANLKGNRVITGNTLILSGVNNIVTSGEQAFGSGTVRNFETIKLDATLPWDKENTVLKAVNFENYGTLDVSAVDYSEKSDGVMTLLLSSGTDNDKNFDGLPLKYSGGTATLNADNPDCIVYRVSKSEEASGVTLDYDTKRHTVSINADGLKTYRNVTYTIAIAADKMVNRVKFDSVNWQKDAVLFDGSSSAYNYSEVTALGTDKFAITYDKPETVSAGESMTLLKANETLQDIAAVEKQKQYTVKQLAGDVTLEATLTGSLAAKDGRVTFTTTANQADKLTFGDVEWKDNGALIDHKTSLSNVTFKGAAVDTTKINFTNKESMEADKQMTLVSDFGGEPGTITGSKYKVGTAYEGEGSAAYDAGSDRLVFKTKTAAGVSDETHTTVMSMEAGVALLAAGSEHVGNAVEGLGLAANAGADGTATFASMGGSRSRYETGSHVNANTWNAIVAVGRKNETAKGNLEYGLFGEYGKSSYTLHSDAGRGDGDAHYAGGGLLAKWTNKHDLYTEASFRLGRMSDSASDILHDGLGNAYGYNVHANYYGGHLGIGKVFKYNGGKNLDVYGKYFYTRRDGVNFTAGVDRYDLDAVASSVLRIGARYGTTDKKWNWYGGLAYEYEFDGKAEGRVNGNPVRAASVQGGSVRGELGMRMEATKSNPWKVDISIYGYGGKHRGFGGNVGVAYTF